MITDKELSTVSILATRQLNLEKFVADAELQLAELKEELDHVKSELLPDAMAEAGVESFTLANGYTVSIKNAVFASIPEKFKEQAFSWLRAHNAGSIIKNQFTLQFGKGDDDKADKLKQLLESQGLEAEIKQAVHPMTLKAFIKEQLEQGVEFPMDVFGATVKNFANVKEPK
jgi:hypothetical protein